MKTQRSSNWQYVILGVVLLAISAFTGCGGGGHTNTVDPGTPPSDGSGGTPPPVVNPPPPPPPPESATFGFDVEVCSNNDLGPEILVKPGALYWGDSYDAFIIQKSASQNGANCYAARLERLRERGWKPGSWFVAVFNGDIHGDYPAFVDTGHVKSQKHKLYINGQFAFCVVTGHDSPPDGNVHAHINGADRFRHNYFWLNEAGETSLDRDHFTSDEGYNLPLDCSQE